MDGKGFAAFRSVLSIQKHDMIGTRVERGEDAVANLKMLAMENGISGAHGTREVDRTIPEEAAAIAQGDPVDASGVTEEETIKAVSRAAGEGGRGIGGEGGVRMFAGNGPRRDDMAVVDCGRGDFRMGLGAGDSAVETGDVGTRQAFDTAGFQTVSAGLDLRIAAIIDENSKAFVGAFPSSIHSDHMQVAECGTAGEDVDGDSGQSSTGNVSARARVDGETFNMNMLSAAGSTARNEHLDFLGGNPATVGGDMIFVIVGQSQGGPGGALDPDETASVAERAEVKIREGPGAARFEGARVKVEAGILPVLLQDVVKLGGVSDHERIRSGAGARPGRVVGTIRRDQVEGIHFEGMG